MAGSATSRWQTGTRIFWGLAAVVAALGCASSNGNTAPDAGKAADGSSIPADGDAAEDAGSLGDTDPTDTLADAADTLADAADTLADAADTLADAADTLAADTLADAADTLADAADTLAADTLADAADTLADAGGPAPGTCAVVQRRTVSTGGPTRTPSIAWSNGSYQVVWNDGRSGNADVFTTWLNRDGSRRAGASDMMVAHTGFVTTAVRSSPMSNGSSLFVWEDCRPALPDCADGTSVATLMVDQSGVPMGAATNLTGVAKVQRRPYVVSALGGAYVTYRDVVGTTTVARVVHLTDSGALTTDSISLGGESAGLYPFIASGNGELAVVFSRGLTARDIVLTRLDAALTPLATLVVRTGATPATNPVTVWNGSGWMVAWEDTTTDSVQARTALASADATSVGASRFLQDSEGDWPQVASQGGDTGVAFYGFPNNAQIMFARLNSAGQGIGPVIQVSDDSGRARYPAIAASDRGGDFGIVWSEEKSGELIFAEVECR